MGAPHVAQRAATAERRGKAVKMRLAGHSWQAIADALDYKGKGNAYNDVRRALEKAVAELAIPVEALRELELQRLDAELVRLTQMQEALWAKAADGDLRAIDTGLRIEEARRRNGKRRAELLGLDAPQRHELTLEALDAELADTEARIAAARSEEAEAAEAEGGEG